MTMNQILAATITIAFEGLMMFQSHPDGSRHVAIVDARDRGHTSPHIEIWRMSEHAPELEHVRDFDLRKDDTVSFDVAPADVNPREVTSLYYEHVPNLREFIVQGRVDDDVVAQRAPTGGVMAFVAVPAGRLTTWRTFPQQVELTNSRNEAVRKCFARFVISETTISSPVLMIVRHASPAPPIETFQIEKDDLIVVSNIGAAADLQISHFAAHASHFSLYGRLLGNDGRLGASRITNDRTCSTGDGVGELSNKAAEAHLNGLMNMLAPNSDCGPTGP